LEVLTSSRKGEGPFQDTPIFIFRFGESSFPGLAGLNLCLASQKWAKILGNRLQNQKKWYFWSPKILDGLTLGDWFSVNFYAIANILTEK